MKVVFERMKAMLMKLAKIRLFRLMENPIC